jgi:diguanylate cyclase (GGDEF)-like protein
MFGFSSVGAVPPEQSSGGDSVIRHELQHILDTMSVRTVFQPVVSLLDATIIGYEALSRGPAGSPLERPDALFRAANKFNLVWELEYLCRSKALEKARQMQPARMIFINIDPRIINDPRFQKGLTREILDKYQMDATNVIFEITEKTAVEDYRNFRKVLDNYTSQGYKIAIDDTGSGYSGLRLLAQTNPHYIKVDMELVRNIDKDGLKQAMMRALYDFAVITNSKIIAEGIETEDELATLIDIGVPYGQGYVLQKPAPEFLAIAPGLKQFILSKNERKRKQMFHTPLTIPIGEIARRDVCFSPDTLGHQAIDYFNANPNVAGIAVVENSQPLGLLMKNKLLASLATQYGVAVYMNRPVRLLMDRQPLIVDYSTPLEQVSKSALARVDDSIYDYIIIVVDGEYYGITSIKHLLEKTSQLELNRAKHSNPLTGLPGNIIIEEKLKQVVTDGAEYAVLYFDLDNFKAYNDVYGFESGDKLLCATAELIAEQLQAPDLPGVFLGHIGGDDFVAISKHRDTEQLCLRIIAGFDARIMDYYSDTDKRRGYIITHNRHGVKEKFPLVSLSIAVVTNASRSYRDPEEIAAAASLVKKQCKMVSYSCYRIA